ncbi:MAG: DUF523 domain-containing protein [Pseudomonadota bacterium]|nr:DUF523 domain-containing protein [Pseudomonadota bacterium]
MVRILISACLLGEPVRYDSHASKVEHEILNDWAEARRVVSFCPEVAGGLPAPRPPAEIVGGDGEAVLSGQAAIRTRVGDEVTQAFLEGAKKALELCRENGVRLAVMADNSPSCGSTHIHDGGFAGILRPGRGVTTALLEANGVRVFNQHQLRRAAAYLQSLESN